MKFHAVTVGTICSFACSTILLVVGFLPLPAQESSPRFAAQSNLVLIPTHVRQHGKHVSGLSKEDFELLQDGRPQKIAVFEELRSSSQRLVPETVRPNEFTNNLVGDPKVSRYTIIAIDRINATAMDMNRLRDGLSEFLASVASSDVPVGLIAVNPHSVELVHDFTSDPKLLKTALEQSRTPAGKFKYDSNWLDETLLEIGPANAEGVKDREQAMVQFQERSSRITSLEALQRIALSLAGLPGHKSLVWVSSGYPFASLFKGTLNSRGGDESRVKFTPENAPEALGLDEYTMRLLNSANVAVYPVDARTPSNSAWNYMDPSLDRPQIGHQIERLRDQDVITTFEHLAAATGGKACYGRVQLKNCFQEALDDAGEYYILGYYLDRTNLKEGWHKVEVKLTSKKGTVRSRNGFLYTKLTPDSTKTEDMRLALSSRLLETQLPFFGRWSEISRNGNKRVVEVQLNLPSGAALVTSDNFHLNIEIAVVARNRDGSVASQFGQHVEHDIPSAQMEAVERSGIAYTNKLELSPGRYLVRLVVRDNNTGRIGSLSTPLIVE